MLQLYLTKMYPKVFLPSITNEISILFSNNINAPTTPGKIEPNHKNYLQREGMSIFCVAGSPDVNGIENLWEFMKCNYILTQGVLWRLEMKQYCELRKCGNEFQVNTQDSFTNRLQEDFLQSNQCAVAP